MKKNKLILIISIVIIIILAIVVIYNVFVRNRNISSLEKEILNKYPDFTLCADFSFGDGVTTGKTEVKIGKSNEKFIIGKEVPEENYSEIEEFTFNNNEMISNFLNDSVYFYTEIEGAFAVEMIVKGKEWNDMENYREDILNLINVLDTDEYFAMYIFMSPDSNINTDSHKTLLLRNYTIYDRIYNFKEAKLLDNLFFLQRDSDEEKSKEFWSEQFDLALEKVNQ